MQGQTNYSTNLSDAEWELMEPLVPRAKHGGRPEKHPKRQIVDGLRYVTRTGCAWRLLPHDFPPWPSVYHYFRKWRKDGTWKHIHDHLRGDVRRQAGRQRQPSAAVIDSQSVKTTEKGGCHGYDAGKKVNGRKRHLLVDVMGLVLAVVVHPANIQDRDGAKLVLDKIKNSYSRLRLIWADGGYAGQLLAWVQDLRKRRRMQMEIVKRTDDVQGFKLLPHRWVVERTFAWLGRHRRLSKDYEYLTETSEAMIHIVMIELMLRRLANS